MQLRKKSTTVSICKTGDTYKETHIQPQHIAFIHFLTGIRLIGLLEQLLREYNLWSLTVAILTENSSSLFYVILQPRSLQEDTDTL